MTREELRTLEYLAAVMLVATLGLLVQGLFGWEWLASDAVIGWAQVLGTMLAIFGSAVLMRYQLKRDDQRRAAEAASAQAEASAQVVALLGRAHQRIAMLRLEVLDPWRCDANRHITVSAQPGARHSFYCPTESQGGFLFRSKDPALGALVAEIGDCINLVAQAAETHFDFWVKDLSPALEELQTTSGYRAAPPEAAQRIPRWVNALARAHVENMYERADAACRALFTERVSIIQRFARLYPDTDFSAAWPDTTLTKLAVPQAIFERSACPVLSVDLVEPRMPSLQMLNVEWHHLLRGDEVLWSARVRAGSIERRYEGSTPYNPAAGSARDAAWAAICRRLS